MMTELPTVSIMVPAKNEELTISKCLLSIVDSDYPKEKLDIIVVVDGSTDRTLEIAEGFKPQVRVVKLRPQKCKASALNKSISLAKGEIVGIFDSDCVIDKSCIKNAVQKFRRKEIAGVTGTVLSSNKKTLISRSLSLESSYISFVQYLVSYFGKSSMFMGKNMFIRKTLLEEIKFDEYSFAEDFSLSFEMWKKDKKIVFERNAIAYQEEPSNFKSFIKQRKRWCRGIIRATKTYKNDGFLDIIKTFPRGIYFYLAPFGSIIMILYLISIFLNNVLVVLPLMGLWIVCASTMAYSKIFFKESTKDLLLFPLWFLLSNIHIPLFIHAYIQERRGAEMKWFKAERK